jgi:hypothetical protein
MQRNQLSGIKFMQQSGYIALAAVMANDFKQQFSTFRD